MLSVLGFRSSMRATTVITLAFVLAAGGCGGEPKPDREAAPDTVADARDALMDGDGEKACDQFTEAARRQLSVTLAALAGGSPMAPCDQVAGSIKALIPPVDRARVNEPVLGGRERCRAARRWSRCAGTRACRAPGSRCSS